MRPEDKRHMPWLERVTQQAHEAFTLLEKACGDRASWLQGDRPNAADVAVAVAWRFSQIYTAAEIDAAKFPALVAYTARAETHPAFASTPIE
jgi:glutathione S-transferase